MIEVVFQGRREKIIWPAVRRRMLPQERLVGLFALVPVPLLSHFPVIVLIICVNDIAADAVACQADKVRMVWILEDAIKLNACPNGSGDVLPFDWALHR